MTDQTEATIGALNALGSTGTPDLHVYLPLERAVLCADCDRIFRIERATCPSCAGGSALNLAHVLSSEGNRELVEALRAVSRLLSFAKRPSRPRAKKKEPR